jgi:glutamate--cysteine ligase
MSITRSTCRCISSSARTSISNVRPVVPRLLAGKLPGHGNLRATQSDWVNHVVDDFPEVRLKRYLEMRGARLRGHGAAAGAAGVLGRHPLTMTLARCRVGPVQGWSAAERQTLRDDVTAAGFKAQIRGRHVLDLARDTHGAWRGRAEAPQAARS